MSIVSLFLVYLSLIQLIQCNDSSSKLIQRFHGFNNCGHSFNNYQSSGRCPPAQLLAPCKCIDDNIMCHDTSLTSSDLVDVFKRISRESIDLHFNTLSICQNHILTEIRANTFQNVTFKEVDISNCPNLVDVDDDAFSGVQDIATHLSFLSPVSLWL